MKLFKNAQKYFRCYLLLRMCYMINIYVSFLVLHDSVYDNILYRLLMAEKLNTFLEFTFFSGNIIFKHIKFSPHLFQWIAFIAPTHVFECEALFCFQYIKDMCRSCCCQ